VVSGVTYKSQLDEAETVLPPMTSICTVVFGLKSGTRKFPFPVTVAGPLTRKPLARGVTVASDTMMLVRVCMA